MKYVTTLLGRLLSLVVAIREEELEGVPVVKKALSIHHQAMTLYLL